MALRDRIVNSTTARAAYKIKFYIDVGMAQVAWVSGKFPDIAGLIIITDRLGYPIPKEGLIGLIITAIFCLLLLGYFWKRTGLYDTERNITGEKDPVTAKLLHGAAQTEQLTKDCMIYNRALRKELVCLRQTVLLGQGKNSSLSFGSAQKPSRKQPRNSFPKRKHQLSNKQARMWAHKYQAQLVTFHKNNAVAPTVISCVNSKKTTMRKPRTVPARPRGRANRSSS